ncbi:MAG: hypothetical protein K2Q20_05420 [Phycisphaerales bacterium]|nr:hypothetical protein [Phycisphaerales bacterium]
MSQTSTVNRVDALRDTDESVTRPFWSRVAWGPVVAGAVAAIGVQLLFTVLGMAIGLGSVNAYEAAYSTSPREVTIAAGAWWIVSGTISLLIGGMVLGRLAGLPRSNQLHLHAFTMWAVTAIFGFMVLWSGAGMASTTAAAAADTMSPTTYGTAGPSVDRTATTNRTASDAVSAVSGTAGRRGDLASAEEARRYARNTAW